MEDVVVQTVLITFFVLSLIMVLEYLNVLTVGHVHSFMHRNTKLQIVIAALLGIVPGCVGSFTAVSLYTHDVIGFGALLANLIATTGDEAFLMVTVMPDKALVIFGLLLVFAVVAGYAANAFSLRKLNQCGQEGHFVLHTHHDNHRHQSLRGDVLENLKHVSAHRLILLLSITTFIVLTLCGFFKEHHHGGVEHEDGIFTSMTITSLLLAVVALFITLRVPEHFLEDHIWHHVVGKHFMKVLAWTSVTLTAIFVIDNVFDLKGWVTSFSAGNVYFFSVLAAIIIGLIPVSGPHLIFITLYCSGVMPFGALLANCIVQDGHGAIPLFAESKKDFFVVKGIKAGFAAVAGVVGWFFI